AGGTMTQESSIHVSNVMIIDEETKKPSRVGYRKEAHTGADGTEKVRKVRLSTRTGQRSRPRLKQRYLDEIVPQLRSDFGYANVMQVPKVTKIVVNMAVGEAA